MDIDLNLNILSDVYGDIDVTMDILCPEGVAMSPWFETEEKTDEDLYNDYLDSTKNRNKYMLEQRGDEYKPLVPLTYEAFLKSAHYEKEEPDYYAAFIELFSNCAWDIFSGNNAVMKGTQKIDLGSWRGSAQFIADFVNHYCHVDYKYNSNDFYCGNIDDTFRKTYLPIYEIIFSRLKTAGCTWIIDEDITMAIDAEFGEEMEQTEAMKLKESNLLAALAENMNKEQLKRVEKELKTEHEKDQLNDAELPSVVQAYLNVYGIMPPILKK
jgi:hypothetical protein